MALGNLRAIGPVTVDYRNPTLRWTSQPTSHGIRTCTISGTVTIAQGDTLAEMVANPGAQETIGGFTGVKEFIEMDGDSLASKEGEYLLMSFDLEVEHRLVFGGRVSFSLNAAYLGDMA